MASKSLSKCDLQLIGSQKEKAHIHYAMLREDPHVKVKVLAYRRAQRRSYRQMHAVVKILFYSVFERRVEVS